MIDYRELVKDINIDIYADGADLNDMHKINQEGYVAGFTTNPTLMKMAGVTDYMKFASDALDVVKDLPISFEVFTDDLDEMVEQAKILSSLGHNVLVKIPVMNTKGEMSYRIIKELDEQNIRLNVTAVFTTEQVRGILESMSGDISHIISVFAGRVADTGKDPLPIMKESLQLIKAHSKEIKLLWASPREIFNLYQANEMGCDIITATPSQLSKLKFKNKDLHEFSRETVLMFYNDATKSGYKI